MLLTIPVAEAHRQTLNPTYTRVLHDAATIQCRRIPTAILTFLFNRVVSFFTVVLSAFTLILRTNLGLAIKCLIDFCWLTYLLQTEALYSRSLTTADFPLEAIPYNSPPVISPYT